MYTESTRDEIQRLMDKHLVGTRTVADILHVAPSTVRAWLNRQNPAPYMAAELLRRILEGR